MGRNPASNGNARFHNYRTFASRMLRKTTFLTLEGPFLRALQHLKTMSRVAKFQAGLRSQFIDKFERCSSRVSHGPDFGSCIAEPKRQAKAQTFPRLAPQARTTSKAFGDKALVTFVIRYFFESRHFRAWYSAAILRQEPISARCGEQKAHVSQSAKPKAKRKPICVLIHHS